MRNYWEIENTFQQKVRYQNEQMQLRLKTFTGWTAQIIQHEIDHCNGTLI